MTKRNKYWAIARLIWASIKEWDEVYLTDLGRVITGAEWDALRAMDEARFSTADEGDQCRVGACWVRHLHLEIED